MSLDRSILRIALPAIVSNITTPVLGLVDVAIVGHFGSATFIGAIAIGGTMFNMLYWLFGFLRMGTAGLTAQSFGARDAVSQSATLRRSLAIALTLGVVLIALSPWLSPVILRFVDCEASSAHLAQRYFGICILGAPAVLGMYALTGWWLGMQDTRTPMCVAIGIDTANILVSLILVYGLHLRIEGVATGTVAAQWLGFLAGVTFIALRYRPQRVALRRLLDRQALRRLFTVNTDIFLRTLCLVAVTVWFTRAGSEQGADILAANAVLMQLFMLFSYFSDGFAFAGEALAGKATGAGDSASLRAAGAPGTGVGMAYRHGIHGNVLCRRRGRAEDAHRRRGRAPQCPRVSLVGRRHTAGRYPRIHLRRRIHRHHPHPGDAYRYGHRRHDLFRRILRTQDLAGQPRPLVRIHHIPRRPLAMYAPALYREVKMRDILIIFNQYDINLPIF